MAVFSRFEVAVRLDIPLEMASKHGIPTRMSERDFDELDTNPPPWLVQSRANRTGKRPVWMSLTCDICGYTEAVRPKKWWPEFTYISCTEHSPADLPDLPESALARTEIDGIGTRFVGIVDA